MDSIDLYVMEKKSFDNEVNVETPRWRKVACKVLKVLKDQALLIATLAAVILGIAIGIGLRGRKCPEFYEKGTNGCSITNDDVFYLEFPGTLLMNLLKMIILPLIFTSMIASLSKMTAETSGKLGGVAVGVFLSTTVISVIIALILVKYTGRWNL
ncbi:hypothetical protein ACOME3_002088 [Neoechinorhynchus agilis]